jgi:hypothetical protein
MNVDAYHGVRVLVLLYNLKIRDFNCRWAMTMAMAVF